MDVNIKAIYFQYICICRDNNNNQSLYPASKYFVKDLQISDNAE